MKAEQLIEELLDHEGTEVCVEVGGQARIVESVELCGVEGKQHVILTIRPKGALIDSEDLVDTVRCSLCGELANAITAHWHQDQFVGDECCWDERLRATE